MLLNNACITLILGFCYVKQVLCLYQANCECGVSENVNRIVGGRDALAHKFPWMVPIFLKNTLYCGGAIINNRYILTAGHCVKWSNQKDITVRVGVHDIRKSQGVFKVDRLIPHPEFFSHKLYDENDIALMKLHKPIQFTPSVLPVCLPGKGSSYDNQYASVAGWGRLKAAENADKKYNRDKFMPKVLQETLVKVLSNKECATTRMAPVITPTVMCAYFNKADSCQGDSGGPLVFEREPGKMEQIAVVSWGIGCASNTPGIYTKVSMYLDWIYDTASDGVWCQDTK